MSESSADEPVAKGKQIDPGGHPVPADDSPVPAGPATVSWARPWQEPNRLVLRAPHGCAAVPLLLGGGGAFLVALSVFWPFRPGWGPADTIAIAFAFLVPAALAGWFWFRQVVLPRVTFDREAQLLIMGWRGRRGRRPLSSIIGVQVMETRKHFGGPELNIPALTMYQVNLILDDPAERRLNVLTVDPWTARSNAKLVADFLGVPVLDSAGDAAAAAATANAADPMAMPPEHWAIPSPVVVKEAGPDVLLIRPRRLAFLLGPGPKSLMTIPVLLGVLLSQGGADGFVIAIVVASACFVLFALIYTLSLRARFDRLRGVLTVGRRGLWPLESVKAVALVEGTDCQLHLVLDDVQQRRIILITDAQGAVVRRAAERVASFLGVRLVETRRSAPRATPTGAAGAVNPLEELSRSPLPPGKASIRGPAHVVPKGADGLLLRPRLPQGWAWVFNGLFLTGLGFYLTWLVWIGPAAAPAGLGDQIGRVLIVLLGLLFLLAPLKPLLLYRDHFDRQAELLRLGWRGLRGTYPLAKVLAVQLIPGGLVPGPSGPGAERVSYQMNLVMEDAYEDRLNLTDVSDLKWTRQAAQEVADFLGVPLIDQIAEDG
jgi:hypothetical protein